MPRNFNIGSLVGQLGLKKNDPRTTARVGLGALLLCNLVAGWFVFSPIGGSADEMETRLLDLQRQVSSKQAVLKRSKELAAKVDKGRLQGDEFLGRYFLSRPTTYSTLVGELNSLAKAAGVRPKEQAFNEEEVEGSDELGMVSITAGYEGSYADLLHFLRELDKANRLVIIESLAASPQQGTGVLNISLRLNTFIRETPVAAQLAALTQPRSEPAVPPATPVAQPVTATVAPSPMAPPPAAPVVQPRGATPSPLSPMAPPPGVPVLPPGAQAPAARRGGGR
jgi:Tfp pilus assembly protein PilO